MLDPGQGVVVAVSGGPDSSALLAVLAELASDLRLELVAAHLNHSLRGDASDGDERAAGDLARRLGVAFRSERLVPGALSGGDGGLEQAARHARYDFLRRVAAERGCARIATGHTRDDQAETVLFRLLRGSGKRGLSGIQPVRADGVVRPLIEVGRAEVREFLQRRGIGCVQDASNDDLRFTRNRIRREVLPLLRRFNPRVAERLAALGEILGAEAEVEEALAHELLRARIGAAEGLSVELLEALPFEARRIVSRQWLQRRRGDLRRIDAAHIDAIVACASSGREVRLPGRAVVANEHGTLRYRGQESPAPVAPCDLAPGESVRFGRRWHIAAAPLEPVTGAPALPTSLLEALFDADRLALPLCVRGWRPGDRIRPLGMSGHRKLSDVLIDAKVPRAVRPTVPVVEAGGEIVWVPGLVRSDSARIGASTRRLLRLRADRC